MYCMEVEEDGHLGVQVIIGALFGAIAARVVDGSVKRGLSGWHPLKPSSSAKTLALTTAAATGIPNAAPALLARPRDAPSGTPNVILKDAPHAMPSV